MHRSRRAIRSLIAFAAVSTASLPVATAVAQPPSIRVEPVHTAGSASARLVAAQIDLAGLEAGARQAQRRYATALAREHAAAQAAVASERRSDSALTTAARDLDTLGAQLDAVLQRTPTALGELSEAADQDLGTLPSTPSRHYEPDIAKRAVDFALAQIGKPYVWGATGPGSFDCSGLAMRAYQAAGVRLPHFAAFQYATSHPLARRQLRPGDLLFWATNPRDPATIYHEAIYLGGRLMVQAPKSHWRISVANMRMWGPIQFYARPY